MSIISKDDICEESRWVWTCPDCGGCSEEECEPVQGDSIECRDPDYMHSFTVE